MDSAWVNHHICACQDPNDCGPYNASRGECNRMVLFQALRQVWVCIPDPQRFEGEACAMVICQATIGNNPTPTKYCCDLSPAGRDDCQIINPAR